MFDWQRILMNDAALQFLLEVALRTTIMFVVLLVILKLAGKRGIKQLSIFEMVIIISLGSAAGDPMFYEDVGIIPAVVVLIVVVLFYRIITWLTGKSTTVEKLLEGKTVCLLTDGVLTKNFDEESLGQDELFTFLRLKNVEHLGQVKKAYLETSGDVSVFFFEDKNVKPGLPVLPELFDKQLCVLEIPGRYCCRRCGRLAELGKGAHQCESCGCDTWIAALDTKRVG